MNAPLKARVIDSFPAPTLDEIKRFEARNGVAGGIRRVSARFERRALYRRIRACRAAERRPRRRDRPPLRLERAVRFLGFANGDARLGGGLSERARIFAGRTRSLRKRILFEGFLQTVRRFRRRS